jgi:predicted site-specific integrase-resolvase
MTIAFLNDDRGSEHSNRHVMGFTISAAVIRVIDEWVGAAVPERIVGHSHCRAWYSAGSGKDELSWWRFWGKDSGMRTGIMPRSARLQWRSRARAGTDWHSSDLRARRAGNARSGLVRKSNPEGKVPEPPSRRLRCAIYTRKSTEEGLDQEFNSLDAQREAAAAFIQSQRREGWIALPELYDDGGFSGANMDRPALGRLFDAVEAGDVDCVVVYKVDRLSRSLLDFTRMLSIFEKHQVSFVAVTQQFNTSTSLGRLTLNILLSFAQFEREPRGSKPRSSVTPD